MTGRVSPVTAHRLRALVAEEQVRARMPSLVAGIVRDGELVWSGSHGGHTGSEPPSVEMQYRIGSITKTMTAVLVMQLRDEGRLDLNDPLGRHLPGVGYGDRTIRALMSHSSGMQSEPVGPWWERSPGVSFDELAEAVDPARAPLPPGHQFHYTNLAWALLGEMVARLRGGRWWEQVRSRILEPLGMGRTTYLPQPPAAAGFSVHPFAGTLTQEPATDTRAMAPAGQLWSTVADLATYAQFLVLGHGSVLSDATVAEMAIPQSGALSTGLESGYGLGVQLVAGGSGTLVGHGGSMPGFQAGILVDRERRAGAVCLANGTTGLRGLPARLLETLEELEPTVPEPWYPTQEVPELVAAVLGVWHWGNTAYVFTYDRDEVVASTLHRPQVAHRFHPRPDGSFVGTSGYHLGEILRVVRDEHGGVNHLECATFVYTRTPYDPDAPIPGGHPS